MIILIILLIILINERKWLTVLKRLEKNGIIKSYIIEDKKYIELNKF